MDWLIESYQISIVCLLAIALANVVANLLVIPVLMEEQPPVHQPLVSVLIPARNEEHRIGKCLKSLLNQSYSNLEILVLDDQSEDDTAGVVTTIRGSNLRLIAGKTLPPGWVGKSWACQQLADEARGELLLFTDADTIHPPGTISAVVSKQAATGADLLTVWPFQVTETWAEKL